MNAFECIDKYISLRLAREHALASLQLHFNKIDLHSSEAEKKVLRAETSLSLREKRKEQHQHQQNQQLQQQQRRRRPNIVICVVFCAFFIVVAIILFLFRRHMCKCKMLGCYYKQL